MHVCCMWRGTDIGHASLLDLRRATLYQLLMHAAAQGGTLALMKDIGMLLWVPLHAFRMRAGGGGGVPSLLLRRRCLLL